MNETRSFLSTAIASGLDFEVMSPEDVIRHISMDVLAHHLPVALKARLLTAALKAEVMNAMLVLDTLGVDAIAEHVPVHLLWECVAAAAARSLGSPASTPSPKEASPVTEPGEPLPDPPMSPVVNAAPVSATSAAARSTAARSAVTPSATARKPNRAAVASRVGAGATSRSSQVTPLHAPVHAPLMEDDDSAFDVDTRVGHDASLNDLDVIEETAFGDAGDDVTSHGHKP